jgi:hypothetical protein
MQIKKDRLIKKKDKKDKKDKTDKKNTERQTKSKNNSKQKKNDSNKINNKIQLNDYEVNRLDYKDAIKLDKRTYIQYYLSLLKLGNLFLFSFIPNNDYNVKIIKVFLFFFSFGLYYTVNALFFTNSIMEKIYERQYDFIYQIPNILYSNLICTFINIVVRFLSLPEKDILKIRFYKKNENLDLKVASIKKCITIKFIFFYIVSFLFLLIFWFFVACFCAVYPNTQLLLIKDTVISFGLSLIYPLVYYLIPGIFRIPSLRSKRKNKECMYRISILLQIF